MSKEGDKISTLIQNYKYMKNTGKLKEEDREGKVKIPLDFLNLVTDFLVVQ